jgi:hypothetical protein
MLLAVRPDGLLGGTFVNPHCAHDPQATLSANPLPNPIKSSSPLLSYSLVHSQRRQNHHFSSIQSALTRYSASRVNPLHLTTSPQPRTSGDVVSTRNWVEVMQTMGSLSSRKWCEKITFLSAKLAASIPQKRVTPAIFTDGPSCFHSVRYGVANDRMNKNEGKV